MGEVFQQWWEDWGDGAITSLEPDEIPATAYPRALNTELRSVGSGKAVVAKRRGVRIVNTTPITGSPAILAQFAYRRVSGGSVTSQRMVWSDNGRLDEIDNNGNLTNWSTSLTTGLYPSVVTANNRLYWVNGVDRKKFDGLTVTNFGIVRPSNADWGTPADVAAGGSMPFNSTYELALTYGNSLVGAESSRSEEKSVTTANDSNNTHRITVTWNAPADTQVDKVYVYLRKTNPVLNTLFLRVGEFSASTLTGTIDASDDVIRSLIILAPGTSQFDPPPAGVRYLAYHEGRIFAADDVNVYYSAITAQGAFVEAFDAESGIQPINPGDGQRITALHEAHEMLLVFKEQSVWGIFGTDPATWEVRQIIPDIGCVSHRSVLTVEGITYWWSQNGPVAWAGSGMPEPIGRALLDPTVNPTGVNYSTPVRISAASDLTNQRVLFAVPQVGSDRVDRILPFSYRVGRWESTGWDPLDVASLGVFEDSTGRPWAFLGSYGGQLFRLSDGSNDGLPAGTTDTGTFVAAATTTLTITDAGATFGSLAERKVTVVDSAGVPVSTYRARISSNTGTVLTLASQIGQLTVGATYTYYIGGPDWQWDSKWEDFGDPFYKKRFEYLYLALLQNQAAALVYADLAFDYVTLPSRIRTIEIDTTSLGTGIWDQSQWDGATWGELRSAATSRARVARTGKVYRVRLRQHEPDVTVVMRKLGMRSERLTDKR